MMLCHVPLRKPCQVLSSHLHILTQSGYEPFEYIEILHLVHGKTRRSWLHNLLGNPDDTVGNQHLQHFVAKDH